jgi:histidinol phosphatase-like enzyme
VVDGVYHCPHHPSLNGPCECRKPGTLLFRRAAADLGLDLRRSAFIGDRRGDVEPARALGGRGFLVRTGYGTREEPLVGGHVEVVEDLEEAVTRLLAEDAPASKQGPPSGPKG